MAHIVFISMSDTRSLLLLETLVTHTRAPAAANSGERKLFPSSRGKSRSLQFISVSLTLGWTRLHVTSCRAIASSHAHGGCYCNLLLTRLWSKAVEIMQNHGRRRSVSNCFKYSQCICGGLCWFLLYLCCKCGRMVGIWTGRRTDYHRDGNYYLKSFV